jgi:hypothetical protein
MIFSEDILLVLCLPSILILAFSFWNRRKNHNVVVRCRREIESSNRELWQFLHSRGGSLESPEAERLISAQIAAYERMGSLATCYQQTWEWLQFLRSLRYKEARPLEGVPH